MKKMIMGLVIIILALDATLLTAQPAQFRRDGDFDRQQGFLALNLSETQKQAMRELRRKHEKELIPLRSQWQSVGLDVEAALEAEEPDLAKINRLVDEKSKIRAEITKKRIAHRLAMVKLLTPEQRKIWRDRQGKEWGRGWDRDWRKGWGRGWDRWMDGDWQDRINRGPFGWRMQDKPLAGEK
ncbi:Spy/CpxP family protein refolding chaperone [bacterium]|nr:Spy/CpxP family protein refolding chaperone [bacterium]